MNITLGTVVRSWGAKPKLFIHGYLSALCMFGVLALLEFDKVGFYLVPPFGATLYILVLLPDAPIAQPYALIVGSVVGASIGTLLSLFATGLVRHGGSGSDYCLFSNQSDARLSSASSRTRHVSIAISSGKLVSAGCCTPVYRDCGVFRSNP
jgi:HPP family